MDASAVTLWGSLLAGIGVLGTAAFAWLGKRGETALNGYTSLTDQLQEERTALKAELAGLKAEHAAELAQERSLRAADQAELTRLRTLVMSLGGTP